MKRISHAPTIICLFGVTGDLTRRKIIPSLYHLYIDGRLPNKIKFFGFSRRKMTDTELRQMIYEILQLHKDVSTETKELKSFTRLFHYHKGDFSHKQDYSLLAKELQAVDASWGMCTNKLFYLAVPPIYYETIFKNLASSKLTKPCSDTKGWTRVIVEKPFGTDKKHAQKLDLLLGKLFKEEQIYRIDHYLAKEILQNILHFRFTNTVFEKHWDNKVVEKIHVKLSEKLGVEKRGSFYDAIGALRDVGQNHLLQMLAFVIMQRPHDFSPKRIRTERALVLSKLRILTGNNIIKYAKRAQYKGYKKIKGVQSQSITETYFHITTEVLQKGWTGIPIILEGGKKMKNAEKHIEIIFKHPTPCMCVPGSPHMNDRIIYELEPEEQISIYVWSKKPGLELEYEERKLSLRLRKEDIGHARESYEKLLLDCISGDQTLFVSTEEIFAMWSFVDPIVTEWKKSKKYLTYYAPGTM